MHVQRKNKPVKTLLKHKTWYGFWVKLHSTLEENKRRSDAKQNCDCLSAEMREDGHLSRVMGEDELVRVKQPMNAGYTQLTYAYTWNVCILCGDG